MESYIDRHLASFDATDIPAEGRYITAFILLNYPQSEESIHFTSLDDVLGPPKLDVGLLSHGSDLPCSYGATRECVRSSAACLALSKKSLVHSTIMI
jgi:hypothetical protein